MSAKDEIIQHGATNCRHLPEVHMLERLHDLEDALLSFQTNYKNNCCWSLWRRCEKAHHQRQRDWESDKRETADSVIQQWGEHYIPSV